MLSVKVQLVFGVKLTFHPCENVPHFLNNQPFTRYFPLHACFHWRMGGAPSAVRAAPTPSCSLIGRSTSNNSFYRLIQVWLTAAAHDFEMKRKTLNSWEFSAQPFFQVTTKDNLITVPALLVDKMACLTRVKSQHSSAVRPIVRMIVGEALCTREDWIRIVWSTFDKLVLVGVLSSWERYVNLWIPVW